MTTALFQEEAHRPALTLVNNPSADPLEAIGALGELEGFVLSVVCLRVERGLSRLDMATVRGLMDEHGLRPAQLVLLGERPLELLNGLGELSAEHAPINAVLTTAVVRYAANLPRSTRSSWQRWLVGQLERLKGRTPFRLTATLPEGLSLHPDANLLEAILRELHAAMGSEESRPPSALETLTAALPALPEAPRPVSTHGLATIPKPPRNRVVSVARPVLPPPSYRAEVRRSATIAVFESLLGPLRLRRRAKPAPAAELSVGPLPNPPLESLEPLSPQAGRLELPDDLTAVPDSPSPLPSLDPEPAPLPRLGIETDLFKSISEPAELDPEPSLAWRGALFAAEPAISFGHVELPERLELVDDVEATRVALREAAREQETSLTMGEEFDQTEPVDEPLQALAEVEANPLVEDESHPSVVEGVISEVPLPEALADTIEVTDTETAEAELPAGLAAIAPVDAVTTVEPIDAVAAIEPGEEPLEPYSASELSDLMPELALPDNAPSLGLEFTAEVVSRQEPVLEEPEQEPLEQPERRRRARATAPGALFSVAPRAIPAAAQEAVAALLDGQLEPPSPEATRALAARLVQVALEQAPYLMELSQEPTMGRSVACAAFPFRITLTTVEDGLVEDPMYVERLLRPVEERSFFDRDDAPLLPPESLGALSGMVGVGFGLWVVLEALLLGNALWMALGLVLMVSLLALDFVLSTDS